MRLIKVLIGSLGLIAVLVAAPVEFSGDAGLVGPNLAAAKPGNGKGRGNGHGAVGGQSSDLHGAARGHAKDGQSNGAANGEANGQANGHAPKDAVSGVEHAPGHAKKAGYDGVKGNLGVQGSFNAIHSAAINKGVVAPQSRVARVEGYLDAAQTVSDIENAEGQLDGDALAAAIEAAALAAADASSQTVTPDMLDRVHDYANTRDLTQPGIEMSPGTTDAVAKDAQDIQSGP